MERIVRARSGGNVSPMTQQTAETMLHSTKIIYFRKSLARHNSVGGMIGACHDLWGLDKVSSHLEGCSEM